MLTAQGGWKSIDMFGIRDPSMPVVSRSGRLVQRPLLATAHLIARSGRDPRALKCRDFLGDTRGNTLVRIGASENGGSAQIRAICASRCLGETAGFAICALCTRALPGSSWRSRGVLRQKLLAKWGLKRLTRKTLWDADHRVPVSEGGGECDRDKFAHALLDLPPPRDRGAAP